jgi:rod shape-determining protein MreD
MTLATHHGGAVIAASFVLALVLTVLPLPDAAQYLRPPWATLVLVYWSIALPDRVGVGIAWTVGILLDVLTGTLLGQHALGLSVVAFIAVKLHQRIRLFPLWQQALTVLIILLVDRLLALWVSGAAGEPPPPFWYWAPAVVGMLLWPWIFLILRNLRRRFRVT